MITCRPVTGLPEVAPGDDLPGLLAAAADLRDGDVLVVTSKVVSKAEGRVVVGDKAAALEREADRLVARYLDRVMRLGTVDPVTNRAFFEVIAVLQPPESLMRPRLAWRVLTRRSPAPIPCPWPLAAPRFQTSVNCRRVLAMVKASIPGSLT